MRSIQLGKYLIDDDSLPFFISEIGSNHQGNTEYCKELITASKNAGASAVKLQKRDNKTFYSEKLFNEPYNNPNSFAPTYGQHREFLDLKLDQWKEVIEFSKINEILLFSTAFDIASADFLEELDMPMYKIPSGGLKNIPLIKEMLISKTKNIYSTVLSDSTDLDKLFKISLVSIDNSSLSNKNWVKYIMDEGEDRDNYIEEYGVDYPYEPLGSNDD